MERRRAPSSYSDQTAAAFQWTGAIGGSVGIAAAVAIHFTWPAAPIWAFSIAFATGFIIFLILFVRARPTFKCPQCGSVLGRETMLGKEDGDAIRFVCATCQIEWESGMNVPRR